MKLLGIDFSNLLMRHMANPYSTSQDSQGRSVNGPVGALAQTIRIIRSEKPTHLLVARDGPRSNSWRREVDQAYKAHRPSADDDLRRQFLLAQQALDLLAWPHFARESYEADDLLASAARGFSGETVIVTGDKDLLACARENVRIHLLRPGGSRECGPEDVIDIMGVEPSRIQEYKALVGDASDGISGVAGIGPKRALALLREYPTLDDLFRAADAEEIKIPGITASVIEKLRQGEAEARLSYRLAGLVDDLHLDFSELLCPPLPRDEDLGQDLEKLGLGDLRKQISDSPTPVQPRSAEQAWRDIFS